jgi:hypothetical protein
MALEQQCIGATTNKGKRKAHKKSRQGCACCKVRRVKCDETKPECKKCAAFGVSCTYDRKAADIKMSFEGTGTLMNMQNLPPSTNHSFIDLSNVPSFQYPVISDDSSTLKMDSLSMERLGRFFKRTALSIGNAKASHIFQDATLGIAFAHPYLMHVIQTITAIHDRYITGVVGSPPSMEEIYHLSQAAALFNKKLSGPIQDDDRDALWATAGLLSQITFSFIEASTSEEAWPLASPGETGLEWIAMAENKMAVWEIANPMRPESIFNGLAMDLMKQSATICGVSEPKIEDLPPLFIKVYDLENDSIADNCPYRATVLLLSTLLSMECNCNTLVKFLSFASHMDPKFKPLLQKKDPKALLPLAYWYAKVLNSIWWLDRRATLECQAICIYLERNHPEEKGILELLQFPKERCGLGDWQFPVLKHCSM